MSVICSGIRMFVNSGFRKDQTVNRETNIVNPIKRQAFYYKGIKHVETNAFIGFLENNGLQIWQMSI